jgi:hypothetical protein
MVVGLKVHTRSSEIAVVVDKSEKAKEFLDECSESKFFQKHYHLASGSCIKPQSPRLSFIFKAL